MYQVYIYDLYPPKYSMHFQLTIAPICAKLYIGKSPYKPIPIGAITYSRAYVTRSILTLFQKDIREHQQKEYLKFLQNNQYEWEYNFFLNKCYNNK